VHVQKLLKRCRSDVFVAITLATPTTLPASGILHYFLKEMFNGNKETLASSQLSWFYNNSDARFMN